MHEFLLPLPIRDGCSYRMGASTPTCPNASLNRSYARNLSYSWRTLGGSSYWHSEPVQHPCRCQSNAVNQRPHEHSCLNGRSGSVAPVSRCRMNVESSLDGTDLRRTCALDVFITVRPVASAVFRRSSSITRIAPPNSWLPMNEQIANAATRTARGIPVRRTQAPNTSVPTAISIRAAPIRANRMAWALSRSISLMTESRRKMVFVMCSFTRPYARESTGRCFGRSPRARPPAWNRCRPPYRSG